MLREGQVKRLDGSDSIGQASFIKSLFRVASEFLHANNRCFNENGSRLNAGGFAQLVAISVLQNRPM